jgi:hypothetical protein
VLQKNPGHASLKVPLIVLGVVLAVAFVISIIAGASSPPQYTISQSVRSYPKLSGEKGYVIEIGINGPAKKMAVLITTPEDQTFTQIIQKENLMDNKASASFPFSSIKDGKYKITLKDFESERVLGDQVIVIQNDLKKRSISSAS